MCSVGEQPRLSTMPKYKTTDKVKTGFYVDRKLEQEFKKIVDAKFNGKPSHAFEAAVRSFIEQHQS